MKAIFDERQRDHDPKHFMANGVRLENPEQPARVNLLKDGAKRAGCQFEQPKEYGVAPLSAIHSPEYIQFLKTIYKRWDRMPNAAAEVIPNIHPDSRAATYPLSAVGQAGYHQLDTACPISADTWQSAYWSAQSAITAADIILAGDSRVYALCRPPGHHAFSDMAGGFCFINNTAVAAQYLHSRGRKPAILDVDVHHGNGTQGIFYSRADVLTVSIHADPSRFYPFFWGYAHERGEGPGIGANMNLPLARGTGDTEYLNALQTALRRIDSFGADVVVVALGLDAHEEDPFQGLSISTQGFGQIAREIAGCGLPMLMIQEGGYLSQSLSHNIESFLAGTQ